MGDQPSLAVGKRPARANARAHEATSRWKGFPIFDATLLGSDGVLGRECAPSTDDRRSHTFPSFDHGPSPGPHVHDNVPPSGFRPRARMFTFGARTLLVC